MKLKQFLMFGLSLLCLMMTVAFSQQTVNAQEQKSNDIYKYIQSTMNIPFLPDNYHYTDWRERSIRFNNLLFDLKNNDLAFTAEHGKNTGRGAFGIVTYTDEERTTDHAQAITLMMALLSAERLNKEELGEDFLNELVQYVESYYNIDNGEGAFLNYQNTSSTDLSFWQQLYPAILYYMLMNRFEATVDSDELLRNIADSWYDVVMDLGGSDGILDFGYTGYDFKNKQPYDNGEWTEPGAAAGAALLQYYAYQKFGDRKYEKAAELCMNYLDDFQRNPGYEILYLYLPYLSARMNSVESYDFNTAKFMEFFFTESDYRHEYGMFTKDFATDLIGERTQYGGTAYSFQSIIGATALAPMLKYDQRYAVEVGRYLLQVTQNLNLFYEVDDSVYGDLIPTDKIERDRSTEDQRLSVLSASALGLLASMIEPTNVEGILKVDLNANEYYGNTETQKPLFLMFNPHDEKKKVRYDIQSEGNVSLYDLVSHRFIEENVSQATDIEINSTDAVIVLEIPIDASDNQFKIDRKVEYSVPANRNASVNIVGLSQYEPIYDDYPIDLEIKTMTDTSVSDITIYIDGRPVFKNVTYTEPYVVKVDELMNGYHILEAEITTSGGVKDYSYARIFIQKDKDPYLINAHAHDLATWESYSSGTSTLNEGEKQVVVSGPAGSGIVSEAFEIDFSQVPMLALEINQFTGPWSALLISEETGENFKLLDYSTEASSIIMNMNYSLYKLNASTYHLLGKHKVRLAIVVDEPNTNVVVNNVRIFNQGLQPLKEREWKSSFTTQKIAHWQMRLNALGKVNYYKGTANILNLNPDGSGGMQTGYFEVDLSKNPQFKIKVDEVDQLWSLLVYVESSERGYYLQYPTDKVGTFTYDIDKVLKKVLTEEEMKEKKNLQFWIISDGDYGAEVRVDYLRLEYAKNWIELAVIGMITLVSVIAIFVNINKER